MKKMLQITMLLIILTGLAVSASAADYVAYELGNVPGYDGDTWGISINNRNQITGRMFRSITDARGAFLWSRETGIVDITVDGGFEYAGIMINDSGYIIGSKEEANGSRIAVIRNPDDSLHDLQGLSDVTWTLPCVINSHNQIAGISGGYVTFWDTDGSIKNLGEGIDRYLYNITLNNAGQVAWTSTNRGPGQDDTHSYIWDPVKGITDVSCNNENGKFVIFDINDAGQILYNNFAGSTMLRNPDGRITKLHGATESDLLTDAFCINNRGQVVGSLNNKLVVWNSDNSIIELPTVSDWTYSWVGDINDSGQIVGCASSRSRGTVPVLWAIPEPSALLTLLCGITGLNISRRRKR